MEDLSKDIVKTTDFLNSISRKDYERIKAKRDEDIHNDVEKIKKDFIKYYPQNIYLYDEKILYGLIFIFVDLRYKNRPLRVETNAEELMYLNFSNGNESKFFFRKYDPDVWHHLSDSSIEIFILRVLEDYQNLKEENFGDLTKKLAEADLIQAATCFNKIRDYLNKRENKALVLKINSLMEKNKKNSRLSLALDFIIDYLEIMKELNIKIGHDKRFKYHTSLIKELKLHQVSFLSLVYPIALGEFYKLYSLEEVKLMTPTEKIMKLLFLFSKNANYSKLRAVDPSIYQEMSGLHTALLLNNKSESIDKSVVFAQVIIYEILNVFKGYFYEVVIDHKGIKKQKLYHVRTVIEKVFLLCGLTDSHNIDKFDSLVRATLQTVFKKDKSGKKSEKSEQEQQKEQQEEEQKKQEKKTRIKKIPPFAELMSQEKNKIAKIFYG